MTCAGCFSGEVLPIPGHFCDFCGRHVTRADVDAYHASMVAPRKHIEDDLFELAIREGGG